MATPAAVTFLLSRRASETFSYRGDRMWPAVRHGQSLSAGRFEAGALEPGMLVLASHEGAVDLFRIERLADGVLTLTADAVADLEVRSAPTGVLAVVESEPRRIGVRRRALNRLRLDVREALRSGPDATGEGDPAATVREKYDHQAPGYRLNPGPGLDGALLARIRARVPVGGSILVVGSGTGRECFTLAEAGWKCSGVDFSPRMIGIAREDANARRLSVDFQLADLRDLEWVGPGLGAVVFTYDVYSFIPGSGSRIALLRKLVRMLEPGGVVFLSARLARTLYARSILTAQWLARPSGCWGDSHTRWLSEDGDLRRSFIHLFTPRALRTEVREAGLVIEDWHGGHGLLSPTRRAAPAGG